MPGLRWGSNNSNCMGQVDADVHAYPTLRWGVYDTVAMA
jgi:hypothetical protein